ncbi:PLP-dependent aminotransferase family protein [Paenibacillus sp. GCM10027627]|uniref:MocR-like pyridoxine biosynthesis transcription factor PdxR n=1 Tax=unclassified Paenibacillus TaxID=185978 RepID=UPI0036252304
MYGIYIEKGSPLSVTRQICGQLRSVIESGGLAAGTRLLPTRVLAKEWGIARNIVIEAYEQLTAEGYLEGRTGSGTFVAEGIATPTQTRLQEPLQKQEVTESVSFSSRDIIDFATGLPDQTLFPRGLWAKYVKKAAEADAGHVSGYGNLLGDPGLRAAIADYLYRTKGIDSPPERIMIVSGSSEGMLLTALALSADYHSVYVEDPTIGFARDIFSALNYRLVPVGVDHNGMDLDNLTRFEKGHLALLTPSHQFPTGSLLSIQRRQKAIRMAEEAGAYLLEDDYDSEFRLKGIPVPPMLALSPARVIYMGTFSKTLSPGLRIGFLIAPPNLVGTIAATKERLNLFTPLTMQKALDAFIRDGQLERHILAMKKVYKKRRALLKERLQSSFGADISILGDEAGMHLQVRFHSPLVAELPWHDTERFGFQIERTCEYKISESPYPQGIVLGYGNLSNKEIEEGVARIQRFVLSHIPAT